MSHALVIVALPPGTDPDDVEGLVAEQMRPFCEEDEWFQDGSRWDWWQIGGRWSGHFEPDYKPGEDPRNQEACDLCDGTGTRNKPIPHIKDWKPVEGQCNGCNGEGTRTKWPTSWAADVTGNVATKAQLRERFPKNEDLHAYAFLKEQTWYESDRMGFFGATAVTECQAKAEEEGKEHEGRCIHTCERTGARVVSFGEDDSDRWPNLYWARFIRPLDDDAVLVAVDYHV